MTILIVPAANGQRWPTLGPQVCTFIEQSLVFGPGDLRGEPAVLDHEKRALIYHFYELFPQEHPMAGRRRFKRVGLSLAKGLAKTELAAWIAACELHPAAPVRCRGWDEAGEPIGGPVRDPYIPMVAYTEEQSEELCYGTLHTVLSEGPLKDDFDIGLGRILRKKGDGRAVPLASAPNARDGARTSFMVADEPLALDTPVPTPEGWATMGELKQGDRVFGRDGHVCTVLGVSPIHQSRRCYRVTFGDGAAIVADAGHRWLMFDQSSNYRRERIVTTEEMYRFRWPHASRFRVPDSAPLEMPNVDLPIHPYLLGLWLGDGDARNATISSGEDDLEETFQRIESLGYRVSRCSTPGRAPFLYVTFPDARVSSWSATKGNPANRSVVETLRGLGVLGNKHIPEEYLRASRDQRLALLQGLMDADGHISAKGGCTFVNTNPMLVAQVVELLRTLSYCPFAPRPRTDYRWSKPSVVYKVHFPSRCDAPPFRLARKLARCNTKPARLRRGQAVKSVEPVESVPVRCIAVDSPDYLFRAGAGMVVTHNTHWWTLPRLKQAHQTMMANLPKRRLADAWALEVTTAPEPGAGSIAEDTMQYATAVDQGKIKDSRLFYFHREASGDHDLTTEAGAKAAVTEASGGAAGWRDIDAIVELWRDPTTDRGFWERVWCNRLVKSSTRAFDVKAWEKLANETYRIPDDALVTLGFDGSVFEDATALVATEVDTGFQQVLGCWERPHGAAGKGWQVLEVKVDEVVADAFDRFQVWRLYADPPYWQSWIAKWAGEYGSSRVIEWWTNRRLQMARALESFETAILTGSISHDGSPEMAAHLGNAHRRNLAQRDETGQPLFLIYKERPDSPFKIDLAMAAVLSWEARNDAVAAGMTSGSVYDDPSESLLLIPAGFSAEDDDEEV